MSPRKRRRRGRYVQNVAELAKDDHAIFYVGEMNPLHLSGALDLRKHSRRVILTGYRYNHYMRGHKDVEEFQHFIPSILTQPNLVSKSKYARAMRFIFTRQVAGKYMSLIVQIYTGKRQHEVITFHAEGEPDVRARRRAGLIVWERK